VSLAWFSRSTEKKSCSCFRRSVGGGRREIEKKENRKKKGWGDQRKFSSTRDGKKRSHPSSPREGKRKRKNWNKGENESSNTHRKVFFLTFGGKRKRKRKKLRGAGKGENQLAGLFRRYVESRHQRGKERKKKEKEYSSGRKKKEKHYAHLQPTTSTGGKRVLDREKRRRPKTRGGSARAVLLARVRLLLHRKKTRAKSVEEAPPSKCMFPNRKSVSLPEMGKPIRICAAEWGGKRKGRKTKKGGPSQTSLKEKETPKNRKEPRLHG